MKIVARHPLAVDPPHPFPISDENFREWQRQNGELFLARLPYWKRMAPKIGEVQAAEMLKAGNSEKEIYRIYDEWRRADHDRKWQQRMAEAEKPITQEALDHARRYSMRRIETPKNPP